MMISIYDGADWSHRMINDGTNEILTFVPAGVSSYEPGLYALSFKDSVTNKLYVLNYSGTVEYSCNINGADEDLDIFGVAINKPLSTVFSSLHKNAGTYLIMFSRLKGSCTVKDALSFELAYLGEYTIASIDS